jgi:hypothetical protein
VQELSAPGHPDPRDREAAAASLRHAAIDIEEQLADVGREEHRCRIRPALADIVRVLVAAGIATAGAVSPASAASAATRTSSANSLRPARVCVKRPGGFVATVPALALAASAIAAPEAVTGRAG